MFDNARQNHRDFNHPGDRTPKISEELQERIGLLFRDLIGPIFREPLCGFSFSEAVRGGFESLLDLSKRECFQIVLGVGFGLRIALGFASASAPFAGSVCGLGFMVEFPKVREELRSLQVIAIVLTAAR